MSLATLVSILAVHLVAVLSPGPSFVVTLRVAMSQGLRAAAALSVGFGVGAVLWAFAAFAGVAALLQLYPALESALRWIGAAALLWIAATIWRHARQPLPKAQPGSAPKAHRAFLLGLGTFASNPKATLFFGAIFAGMLPPNISAGWTAALLAGIFVIETSWYTLLAALMTIGRVRAAYVRAKPWLDRAIALLLAGFAVKIALG